MNPPTTPVEARRQAVVCFVGCGLAMALVGALSLALGAPLLFPAIGASAFLVVHAPRSPFSAPRSLLLGHLVGALVGGACASVLGVAVHEPWLAGGEPWRAATSATLALAVTSAAMVLTRSAHPPAGATTLIFATGLMGGATEVAAVLGAAAALLLGARGARLVGARVGVA